MEAIKWGAFSVSDISWKFFTGRQTDRQTHTDEECRVVVGVGLTEISLIRVYKVDI